MLCIVSNKYNKEKNISLLFLKQSL